MRSATTKRSVSLLVAIPALVVLLGATRTWLTGRSTEPLLGGGNVSATGSQLAPGVVALALVCLAALVAMLTGGPGIRRTASVLALLAAGGAVALAAGTVTDQAGSLGRVAASGLGRTGTVATTATATGWLWVSVTAAVALVLTTVLGVVAVGRWAGLSARFESPAAAGATEAAKAGGGSGAARAEATPGGRGTRRNAWDEVSEGRDPTLASTGGDHRAAAGAEADPDPGTDRDVGRGPGRRAGLDDDSQPTHTTHDPT